MRFMIMHKMTEQMEKGLPPDTAVIEDVGKLIEEAIQEKVFVAGEGLKPSSQRLNLVYRNGQRRVTEGPFTQARELVADFALMRVRSQEEAIAWCDRFAAAIADGKLDVEIFLGPVVEPWDLGMPKPDHAPLRFLATHTMDPRLDKDAPPERRVTARMAALIDEMTRAGVLEATGGLLGTQRGARVQFQNGKHTVIDGPFAESKELIAGYAIFDLPSKAAAIQWATRFGDIVKVNQVEIRQMAEGAAG